MSSLNQQGGGYSSDELREQFWTEDALNGSPIKSQYDQIKEALASNSTEFAWEQLQKIKKHAIQNCDFYNQFESEEIFPEVNKLMILRNQEAMMAREGFQSPTHKSSTSGSTGIPFTVTQDYRKRMRTIADLQVFGERCEYPIRERCIYFRSSHAFKVSTPLRVPYNHTTFMR